LQIQGGTLNLGSGIAIATATGSVINIGGTVTPGEGAARTLPIPGSYAQNAGGAFKIELGGPGLGTSYDLLAVGAAQLGGTLELTLINSFVPVAGQSFQILTAGSTSGTFADVVLTNFPAGLDASVSYAAGGVTVLITGG